MIYSTIDTAGQFRDQFHKAGRQDQFSYDALELIFSYLDECGSDVNLDVIAICCEFAEMDAKQLMESYDLERDSEAEIIDYLQDHTSYVGKTKQGNYVFIQF